MVKQNSKAKVAAPAKTKPEKKFKNLFENTKKIFKIGTHV